MYSKEFFSRQFQPLDTDELVEKLGTQQLTGPAREAVTDLLRARQVDGAVLEQRVHAAKKDQYLKTGVTNDCDFCGKSAFSPLRAEGQRFCDIDCFHTSRLRRAAVDIDDASANEHARAIRSGACPRCDDGDGRPDIHHAHYILSMVFVVSTSTESAPMCVRCATRRNLWATAYCATLGWWSIKGLLMAPVSIAGNLKEILARKRLDEPSAALVDWARLMLAEERLRAAGGGRWSLRP